MIYKNVYSDGRIQPIAISLPQASAPFVAQSSYAYGSSGRVDLCRAINAASEAIFDACLARDSDRDHAQIVTNELVNALMRKMGFTLTSTEYV